MRAGISQSLRGSQVSLLANLVWFGFTMLPVEQSASSWPGNLLAGFATYGQGTFLASQLAAAQHLRPRPPVVLSVAALALVSIWQPIVMVGSTLVALTHSWGTWSMSIAAEIISISGALLLAALLRVRTHRSAPVPFLGMLLVATGWPFWLVWISTRGRDLHLPGSFGKGSDLTLHPFATALWQVPIAALTGGWLTRPANSSSAQHTVSG